MAFQKNAADEIVLEGGAEIRPPPGLWDADMNSVQGEIEDEPNWVTPKKQWRQPTERSKTFAANPTIFLRHKIVDGGDVFQTQSLSMLAGRLGELWKKGGNSMKFVRKHKPALIPKLVKKKTCCTVMRKTRH